MKQTSLNYIRAKTPEGLKQLCLQNSVSRGYYFRYSVVYDGKNWFAWYEEDASEQIESQIKLKEVSDVTNQ